jgi:hypothetical protein
MSYKISTEAYINAAKYNVTIKPSTRKGKKIDVFKNDKKIASIGDINYLDYAMYKKRDGIEAANVRLKIYKLRHKNDMNVPNTPGFFAKHILWQ